MRSVEGSDGTPLVYSSRLEALFDATTMATALYRSEDGRVLAANDECKEILHLTDEMIAQGIDTSMLGLVTEELAAVRQLLEATDSARDVDITLERPGHERRRLLVAFRAVYVDGVRCVVANFTDVTERRRLRREMQETQDQLHLFLDLAPAAITLKSLDGRLLWVNKTAAETFAITSERLEEQTNFDIWEPDIATRLTEMDASVIRTGEPVREGVCIANASGEPVDFDVLKFPVTDADHHLCGIGTIGTDVSGRRQADRALRESEARFHQLASSVLGVFILWRAFPPELLYVSPAVERIMGVPASAASFDTLFASVHPDDRQMIIREVLELEPWDQQVIADFRVIHPNGDIRWLRSRTSQVDGVDGGLRRTTIVVDITDERSAKTLLEEARTVADRASNAKNDFMSRMSHELRTPLHAILGFGQLLDAETLTDVQREFTDQIARAGVHLLRLIDEVLDISQIEGGSMRLNLEPLSLLNVMTETLELLEPAADDADCTVRVVGNLAGIVVRADRTRLKQVLLNVVSNAIKYNRPGGDVAVSVEVDPDRTVRIEVVDSGVGIAPDVMNRLFEPFDRLGAEQTRVPGTGLGLALARQLMELMGGSICAFSTLGVGSRFSMALPTVVGPGPETASHARVRPQSKQASFERPARLLVIENDPSSVVLLEAVLRQRPSLTATFARSGAEGLAALSEQDFDFVLLDMHLSDMSGIEILSRIRAESICPGVRIVVLSADALASTIADALALGASAYLTKPFDVAEFWGVLDNQTIAVNDGLSFVYADDDELCRQFMLHLFERYLPNALLTLASDGREALQNIRSSPPDILLLDINLTDMSGLDIIEAVRADALTASTPIIILSAAPPRHDWETTPLTHWLGKPFTVNDFLHLIASLS